MSLLSPGIETTEQNFTSSASPAAFGSAATVGKFQWGPAFEVVSITSESDLLNRMGPPNRRTQPSWYSVQRMATQSSDVKTVRIVDSNAKNSTVAYGLLAVTITQAGTGYIVGDSVTVRDGNLDSIPGATGEVVQVGPNGEVEIIRVDRGDIQDGTDTSSYSITLTSYEGVGCTGTVELISESPVSIKNSQDIENGALQDLALVDLHNSLGLPPLVAQYVGDYGDRISVDLISYELWTATPNQPITEYPSKDTISVNFADILDVGPQGPGQYGAVIYLDGQPAEQFVFSLNEGDRDQYGQSIYLDDMIDRGRIPLILSTALYGWDNDRTGRYTLGGGDDSSTGLGAWLDGWDMLGDVSAVAFQYAAAGAAANESVSDSSLIQKKIIEIMELRQDARARLSPPRDLVVGVGREAAVENVIEWRRGVDTQGDPITDNLNVDTTYATLEDNFKYAYDKFNDQYFWMGFSADAVSRDLFNAREFFPWISAAGSDRAQLLGIVKTAYPTANKGQRDRLYQNSINPITSEPGGGTYINGDKTLTNQATAFNRINVRDLFNLLKRSVRPIARTKLFQINNEFNRGLFREQSGAFLSEIQGLGGVIAFRVVCDETNNPQSVVSSNRFVGEIAVVPPRSINFITLRFGAYDSEASFSEQG